MEQWQRKKFKGEVSSEILSKLSLGLMKNLEVPDFI